jgi:glycosyltransferase involved in cell wall biosynthesis
MKKVLIIESQMNQYRVPFYRMLNTVLAEREIQLTVAYSHPNAEETRKNDTCDLPKEFGRKVPGYWFCRGKVLVQPLLGAALQADLVIIEQANKFVLNHVLLGLSRLGLKRVAFWGLGENRQTGQIRISEKYRRRSLNWVSWWFAYTRSSADYLIRHGVPEERVTVVQNAVDTHQLQTQIASFSDLKVRETRKELGIGPRDHVGLYCGMLHRVKSIPFLLESAGLIRKKLPTFHLIVVGGGSELATLQECALENPWLHVTGPLFGAEKALMFRISDLGMQPGRVGLVILDCFAAGLPLLTTRIPIHGPEIDYLEDGINGLVTEHDTASFAEATLALLQDGSRLERLRSASRDAAGQYSIEAMVNNFCDGIRHCLQIPKVTPMLGDPRRSVVRR